MANTIRPGRVFLAAILAGVGFAGVGFTDDEAPREVLRELEADLREPRPGKRRTTVRRLADLACREEEGRVTRAAWALVVGALVDREPEVADEAQVQLARVTDAQVLRDLLGRSGLRARDAWVRLRVAEALGRSSLPIDGTRLVAALSPREVDLSRTLLWSIERLALAGRIRGDRGKLLRGVERALKTSRDGGVRGQALLTLVALVGGEAAPRIIEHARHREPAVRCAAVEACRALGDEAALVLARGAATDESSDVRAAAVEQLGEIGTRGAALALVGVLESEERSRIRARTVARLQELSGLFYRQDPRPWRSWAEALSESWRGAAIAVVPPDDGNTKAAPRLPVLSDRVAFLIDFSGSLWHVRGDGRTRKEKADALLSEAIDALAVDARFNVMPYTARPFPWKERLQPAGRREREDARRFFIRCRERGQGNFFDAALLALTDLEVDTIVVLTDGVPTGGRRWNLSLMVDLLLERCRFRKVAFDSVVVDAPKRVQREWARLAAGTGGRSTAIEME